MNETKEHLTDFKKIVKIITFNLQLKINKIFSIYIYIIY